MWKESNKGCFINNDRSAVNVGKIKLIIMRTCSNLIAYVWAKDGAPRSHFCRFQFSCTDWIKLRCWCYKLRFGKRQLIYLCSRCKRHIYSSAENWKSGVWGREEVISWNQIKSTHNMQTTSPLYFSSRAWALKKVCIEWLLEITLSRF